MMFAHTIKGWASNCGGVMAQKNETPFLQRVYDSIWLLALAALLFFFLSYVAWGMIDIFAAPPR